MYCPKCGAEYRKDFTRCEECDVKLTAEPGERGGEEKGHEMEESVTVLETSDLSLIPVVKSLLDSADIPYHVKGEGLMNLFPSEALGALLHSSAGEVIIRVPKSRADEARELLTAEPQIDDGAIPLGSDDEDAEPTMSA